MHLLVLSSLEATAIGIIVLISTYSVITSLSQLLALVCQHKAFDKLTKIEVALIPLQRCNNNHVK